MIVNCSTETELKGFKRGSRSINLCHTPLQRDILFLHFNFDFSPCPTVSAKGLRDLTILRLTSGKSSYCHEKWDWVLCEYNSMEVHWTPPLETF